MKIHIRFPLHFLRIKRTIRKTTPVVNRLIMFTFFIYVLNVVSAQEPQAATIGSFSVTGEPLSTVIDKLSKVSQLNFTYDASNAVMDAPVTYRSENKTPLEILSDLLVNTHCAYKQIGNQIVIYRVNNSDEDDIPVEVAVATNIETYTNEAPYTNALTFESVILKLDTIFMKDTVFRIDTVRVIDTVFVARIHTNEGIKKLPVLPVDYFQDSDFRKPGWAIGLAVTSLASDFSMSTIHQGWSLRNYAVSADVVRTQKRWAFSLGIQFSQFAQKFDHHYDISSGGYYLQDTLDAYYTVIETDTSWYYITESTWLPLNSESFNFDRVNRIGYFSVTGNIAYVFFNRPAFSMHVTAGASMNILVYSHGVMIDPDTKPQGVNFGDLTFSSPVFGVSAGFGTQHRLGEKLDLLVDAYYLQYMDDPIQDNNYFNPLSAVGLKVGLRYYF